MVKAINRPILLNSFYSLEFLSYTATGAMIPMLNIMLEYTVYDAPLQTFISFSTDSLIPSRAAE